MLKVGDQDPAPLDLNIPQPCGPVVVKVLDSAGHPVTGLPLTVDRPAGPLAELDWPSDFTTDGAGVVYLPALEAGSHRVHISNTTIDVTPPTLPCDGPNTFVARLAARN